MLGRFFIICLFMFLLPKTKSDESVEIPARNGISLLVASTDHTRLGALYRYDTTYSSIVDIFDSQSGTLVNTVNVAPLIPNDLTLNHDGTKAVFSAIDEDLYVIDFADSGSVKRIWREVTDYLNIKWDPFNDRFGYILGGSIFIFDFEREEAYPVIRAEDGGFYDFFWDVTPNKLLTLQAFSTDIFSPIATSSELDLWTLQEGSLVSTSDTTFESSKVIDSIALSWDGTQIAIGSDFNIQILTRPEFSLVVDLELSYEDVYDLEWSLDSTKLAGGETTINIWSTDTWVLLNDVFVADGVVTNLVWSFDNQSIFHTGNHTVLYRDATPLGEVAK